MIKAIFFDLDGTLLPISEDDFTKVYFHLLYEKVKDRGYDKNTFINALLDGSKKMYKNDGSSTNEEVFWSSFKNVFGEKVLLDKPYFDDFYVNEFYGLKSVCKENPLARKIIDYCKEHFEYVVLATNPLFPLMGAKTRMSFINLQLEDFDFVTAYENSSYTKPNPQYYKELLNKFNLKPDEVIMFGNNGVEDAKSAECIGIKCYLIDGFLLKTDDINKDSIIKMDEVILTLEKYIN